MTAIKDIMLKHRSLDRTNHIVPLIIFRIDIAIFSFLIISTSRKPKKHGVATFMPCINFLFLNN